MALGTEIVMTEYKELEKLYKEKNNLDSLSPYIGKIRPELVDWLIDHYVSEQDVIYDPFSGSGTVLLEGWRKGHSVIGSDLNDYAVVLARGKINPYENVQIAKRKIDDLKDLVDNYMQKDKVGNIPEWVKEFYHDDTLKEICAWVKILKDDKEWFILACLLGILHHQRPGFLSYPASHGTPYLRKNKYPQSEFPELYEYRAVYPRLKDKVTRVYKNMPDFNFDLERKVYKQDATLFKLDDCSIPTIITSPPYMKSLTYARDNRLRLWFLGVEDWKNLDKKISPNRDLFYDEILSCFRNWSLMQPLGGLCILIIGNLKTKYKNKDYNMPDVLIEMATPFYRLKDAFLDSIPEKRKVVKGNTNIKQEAILVFERV